MPICSLNSSEERACKNSVKHLKNWQIILQEILRNIVEQQKRFTKSEYVELIQLYYRSNRSSKNNNKRSEKQLNLHLVKLNEIMENESESSGEEKSNGVDLWGTVRRDVLSCDFTRHVICWGYCHVICWGYCHVVWATNTICNKHATNMSIPQLRHLYGEGTEIVWVCRFETLMLTRLSDCNSDIDNVKRGSFLSVMQPFALLQG